MTTKITAQKPNGKQAEILIQSNCIYLNHSDTGFRLGNDGYIYSKHGTLVQKDQDVRKLLILYGMIKWRLKTNSKELVFFFWKS